MSIGLYVWIMQNMQEKHYAFSTSADGLSGVAAQPYSLEWGTAAASGIASGQEWHCFQKNNRPLHWDFIFNPNLMTSGYL